MISYREVKIDEKTQLQELMDIVLKKLACGENDRAEYGKKLLQYLSEQLTKEFGKGFTVINLKYMRQFYRAFPIRHTLCDKLSWSHYRLLMRIEDEKARKFYLDESVKSGWSVRQIERQIGTFYYERLLASQDKESLIFASKYKIYLPTEEEFKKELNLENYVKKDDEENKK